MKMNLTFATTIFTIFFLIPNQSMGSTENDSTHLKILENGRKFLLSADLLLNTSKISDDEFNEKEVQGRLFAKILPNRKMPLGKYGNYSVFAFSKILYRRINVEDFSRTGPSVRWTSEGESFGLGLGSNLEFKFELSKNFSFITGFEFCFDFLEFINENPGVSVSPFFGFTYKEKLKLEVGDEIVAGRNTLWGPFVKFGILF